MASVWDLPIIFLCENNQYALSTPAHTVTAGKIADRATGFDMPGVRVEDGQNVIIVHEAVAEAVARARAGKGPSLVEVMTYRFHEHSEGLRIGNDYRNQDEREAWLKRDPIDVHAAQMMASGIATQDEIDELRVAVLAEVETAVEFADAGEFPEASVAFKDLYSDRIGGAA